MALTIEQVTTVVRQRLGDADGSMSARYIAQIPTALKEASRKIAADPWLRELLKTDSAVCRLPLDSNAQIDLQTAYDTYQFLMEYFDLGQIYLLPTLVATVQFNCSTTLTITPYVAGFADGDVVTFSVGEGGILPGGIAVDTDYTIINYDVATSTFGLSTGAVECDDGQVEWSTEGEAPIYMTRLDAGSGLPLQSLKNPQQAPYPNYLGSVFEYYVIQGDLLNVAPPRTGFVACSVPKFAKTLAELPASSEVQNIFFQILINLVTSPTQSVTT